MPKVFEQRAAHAAPLACREDIGVTDQLHVANALAPHHADQRAAELVPPEDDPCRDLMLELVCVHVRLVPPVRRNHAAIGLSRIVDDREDDVALVVTTRTDAVHDE